jgi:hypothetical protein
MIGEHTNQLANFMAERMVRDTPSLNLNDTVQDNLSIFRLIVIQDNLRGIATPLPNMPKTSTACLYFVEKMVNSKNSGVTPFLGKFQKILQDVHTLKEFPELKRPPALKRTELTLVVNPLLGMVFYLAKAPGFSVLFPDIYEVCVGLYSKFGWDTRSAKLDNLECSMRRVIPNISLKLSVAIHNTIEHHGNPLDLRDAIWAEVESIPSVNGGDLKRNTRIRYFSDFYVLFFHLKKIQPPDQSDERKGQSPARSSPVGSTRGKENNGSQHGYPGGEDEENQAIEKYSEEYDKLSAAVAFELDPGDAIERIDRSTLKNDASSHTHMDLDARLAVEAQISQFDQKCIPFVILLRIWDLMETKSASDQHVHFAVMNLLQPLFGWPIDLIREITRRKKTSYAQSGTANYDNETHILEIPIQLWDGYPSIPQHNPELYVQVQNRLSLGMPEPIANLLDILANQVEPGMSLFPKKKDVYLDAIKRLNIDKNVHRPKGMQVITEARLRSTFWPLLVGVGGLDPLIASFLSQHWITAAKTPAYYSTLSSPFISQEFSFALHKALNYLATHNFTHLPARFLKKFTAPIPPTTYIGSPFRPAPGVIEAAVDKLQSTINATSDEVAKHNFITVLVILAMDYLCGLRRNETFCLTKENYAEVFELAGLSCGFITLTDDIAKSCGFSFGGRLQPIPRKIAPALTKIVNHGDGPLFRYQTEPGQYIPMTIDLFDSIIDSLGIILPRYHDGRHWLHCNLQEIDIDHQLGFFGINLIMGHQTTGQEAMGRFNDATWVNSWSIYLSLADQLADLIGWRLQEHAVD